MRAEARAHSGAEDEEPVLEPLLRHQRPQASEQPGPGAAVGQGQVPVGEGAGRAPAVDQVVQVRAPAPAVEELGGDEDFEDLLARVGGFKRPLDRHLRERAARADVDALTQHVPAPVPQRALDARVVHRPPLAVENRPGIDLPRNQLYFCVFSHSLTSLSLAESVRAPGGDCGGRRDRGRAGKGQAAAGPPAAGPDPGRPERNWPQPAAALSAFCRRWDGPGGSSAGRRISAGFRA